jgi:hypothetical protein
MTQPIEPSGIEPMDVYPVLPYESNCEPVADPTCERPTNVAATSHLAADSAVWTPTEPQFTKAIATHYGVSRKTVQQWYQKVRTVCIWLNESDLKTSDGRYTPQCIEWMGAYRQSGLTLDAWKAAVWDTHADLVASGSPPDESSNITIPPDYIPVHFGELIEPGELYRQQSTAEQHLTHHQTQTQALSTFNQQRLNDLNYWVLKEREQRQRRQAEKQERWRVEARNDAIEEFILKQQERQRIFDQLEQPQDPPAADDSPGKPSSAA